MIRKITTFLLLIVILTSLFIVVFSSVAYANRPNYTVCWWKVICGHTECRRTCFCCSGFSSYYQCAPADNKYCQ